MAFTSQLNVTDPQEVAVQKLIDRRFSEVDPGERPTPQAFIDGQLSELVSRLRDEYIQGRRQEILGALRNADNATLASVESTLGLA